MKRAVVLLLIAAASISVSGDHGPDPVRRRHDLFVSTLVDVRGARNPIGAVPAVEPLFGLRGTVHEQPAGDDIQPGGDRVLAVPVHHGQRAVFGDQPEPAVSMFTYFLATAVDGPPRNGRRTTAHGPASLAALGLAWGGFAVSHWEFPSAIGTLWSLPLFFLLGLGESWKALAVSWALTFFSGYTQFSYYAAVSGVRGRGARGLCASTERVGPEVGYLSLLNRRHTSPGILLALPQIGVSWENARHSFRTTIAGRGIGHASVNPDLPAESSGFPVSPTPWPWRFKSAPPFGAGVLVDPAKLARDIFHGNPAVHSRASAASCANPRGKTVVLGALDGRGSGLGVRHRPIFWLEPIGCCRAFDTSRILRTRRSFFGCVWPYASTNMAHPGPGRNAWTALTRGGPAWCPPWRWPYRRRRCANGLSTACWGSRPCRKTNTGWVMQAGGHGGHGHSGFRGNVAVFPS
jgi:hypothetical protein